MILDEKVYESSHSMRTAFIDGQIAMTELVIGIVHRLVSEKGLGLSKEKNDFEKGQLSAFESVINGCRGFIIHNKNEQAKDAICDA